MLRRSIGGSDVQVSKNWEIKEKGKKAVSGSEGGIEKSAVKKVAKKDS